MVSFRPADFEDHLNELKCLRRRDWPCGLQFLSERYALEIDDGNKTFDIFIYDVLHEQRRELQSESGVIFNFPSSTFIDRLKHYRVHITVLSFNQFMAHYSGDEDYKMFVYLFQLDFDKLSYKLLDKQVLNNAYNRLLVDQDDCQKFVFVDRYRILKGCVVDSKLQLDDQYLSPGSLGWQGYYFSNYWNTSLKGSKIYGIATKWGNNPSGFIYFFIEIDLDEKAVKELSRISTDVEIKNHFGERFFWRGHFCYSLLNQCNEEESRFLLHKFDINSGLVEIFECNVAIHWTYRKNLIKDHSPANMFYSNGWLFMSVKTFGHGYHVYLKFPIDQPCKVDKLLDLAMDAVRRQRSVRMTQSEYNSFVSKLPKKLRPFEQ